MEAEMIEQRSNPVASLCLTPPSGLKAPEGASQADLDRMLKQLYEKRKRNVVQTRYWEARHLLQDFGISLPPQMRNINVVLGWPAIVVTALASRIMFDGCATVGDNDLGASDILADAMIEATLPQAVTSALVHSCSFVIATAGDTKTGEPPIVMTALPATHATGIWEPRTNTLNDCLCITEEDSVGAATIIWYSRRHITTYTRTGRAKWAAKSQPNPTGRCMAVLLAYRPELTKPFGSPRISRPVMALTDAAMRTLARSEAHAEFFASPQRYVLGADPSLFELDRWKWVISKLPVIPKDEDGDVPKMDQWPQVSMSPHFEHLRAIASLLAGEASLPLDALGIVQDNPSSAEAIYAAKEPLVMEALYAERIWGAQLRHLITTAVMLHKHLDRPPEELRGMRVKWLNPATPSVVSAADAMSKFVNAVPWAGGSEVTLSGFGFDDAQIMRLMADKQRGQGQTALDQLLAAAAAPPAGIEPAAV